MSNPVLYRNTTYAGKQEINPRLCTASLIGCLVLPRDGSYSVVLKNGKMSHDAITYQSTKHNWLVIAENGRFPTDYHISMQGTAQQSVKDDYTNDLMMVNPENPNEIAFAQSRFMEVIGKVKPTVQEAADKLNNLYNDYAHFTVATNTDKQDNDVCIIVLNHSNKFPVFKCLAHINSTTPIEVMFDIFDYKKTRITLRPKDNSWYKLFNS